MASNNNTTEDRKLSEIFDEAYLIYDGLEQNMLPTNSPEFQSEIKKCMRLFEDSTRLVSLIGLYSTNETYDEVATNDLKYLLLPFFLGQLSSKLCTGERKEIVDVAEIYFRDFLKRCEEYGLHEGMDGNVNGSGALVKRTNNSGGSGGGDKFAELTQMAHQRNNKLEQYRQKKELDDEIKKIKILMKRNEDQTEETIVREFYIKLLKASIIECQEELRSIAQELQILHAMSEMKKENPELLDGAHNAAKRRQPSAPLKPIIITKDAVQKAVYGAGYPSLPTMSVDEFYDKRVADGIFPDPTVARDPNNLQQRAMRGDTSELDEQDDIKKEQDEEKDDEEYLARARGMDEFRDDVRRGDGNRHNRS